MRAIGITGGIGAGKSKVLDYVKKHYPCEVIIADEVAHDLQNFSQPCFRPLVDLLGEDILESAYKIDRKKMAERIFSDRNLLKRVNQIIHPKVKEYIKNKVEKEKKEERLDFLFVEAALLLEEHYEEILDEIWYIYADDTCRRERLRENRQYSEEKITNILKHQLQEKEFRRRCEVVIDNGGSLEKTYRQIEQKLEEYLWQKEKNIRDN